ncbi:MAG: hypothetical protein KKH94_10250 [Candidatus Omnitrophica bacterium]|nr:hypothetical protein [Candidatus Omnitrophota bacterium]
MKKKKTIFGILFFCSMAMLAYAQQHDRSVGIDQASTVSELKFKHQSLYADFADNHLCDRLEQYLMFSKNVQHLFGVNVQSQLVNRFDEVPDSYFFTNRNERRAMSLAEITKGADVNTGPDVSKKWVVTKGKSAGRTPGFFITDSRGDKYLIKLDRKDYPEMLSSCEAITSKFFHAIGYNVPQYTPCFFKPDIITVADDTLFYDSDGFKRKLTREKLLAMLAEQAYRTKDGSYRASASKFLEGVPKGYFSFRSHRKLDINDPVPHEHRREVRALRVFSSWFNHHDIRRGNTLDMLVEENSKWYMKHYLIDFGSALGSHNMYYKYAAAGHTYVISLGEVFKSWLSLGLYKRPYYVDVKPFSPAVGYITSEHFYPGKWRPMIPNFAFDNMTKRDAYWAAKIVMSFTDAQIDALVKTGQLSSDRDEAYLAKVIRERRDAIGRYWFSVINPLDNFVLTKKEKQYMFSFENLYKKYKFADTDERLRYVVKVNTASPSGKRGKYKGTIKADNECITIPADYLTAGDQYVLVIKTYGPYRSWRKPVSVFVDEGLRIAGVDRKE